MRADNTFDLRVNLRCPSWVSAAAVVASLDFLSCSLFWGLRGIPATQIAQSVATWVIGVSAYSAGWASVVLGLVVLYAMAVLSVIGYQLAAARHPRLLQAPVQYGALYGLLLFALLRWVVIPLSAAPQQDSYRPDWFVTCLLIYVFLIGIPCALFARSAARETQAMPMPRIGEITN